MKITADAARNMDRFSFIALFMAAITRRGQNRGPVGYSVRIAGGKYRVVSENVTGRPVVFSTSDAAALFDWARRTELGKFTREADEFRIAANQAA